MRRICDGEEIKCKIRQANVFKAQPFGCYSILMIEGFTYALKRKYVNGEWSYTDEHEPVLEEYEVIKNG